MVRGFFYRMGIRDGLWDLGGFAIRKQVNRIVILYEELKAYFEPNIYVKLSFFISLFFV